jgi:SAM-dependent methyltransferase
MSFVVSVRRRMASPLPQLPSAGWLETLWAERYHTDNLVSVSPEEFQRHLEGLSGQSDAEGEGLGSAEGQRERTVQFQWAEDMDFGTFSVPGMSHGRATWLLAMFIDELRALPRDLTGRRVLDIGCWTGKTSLLLAAMGAEATGVEEVHKYAATLGELCNAFGVDIVHPKAASLYDLGDPDLFDRFDFCLFGGVLYHLSDPVVGLRHLYNTLREGGTLLLESAVTRSAGRDLEYAGQGEIGRDPAGANWFFPSPSTLVAMLEEVGYEPERSYLQIQPDRPRDRMFLVARKGQQKDMLRAGLSVPRIR